MNLLQECFWEYGAKDHHSLTSRELAVCLELGLLEQGWARAALYTGAGWGEATQHPSSKWKAGPLRCHPGLDSAQFP